MIRLTRSQVQPIGVDLGADSVRMLQLEVMAGRTLSVCAAARREIPEAAGLDPARRLTLACDLVRQMLRQDGFVGRSIVAAMPREIVHVKNLRLPKIPPAELDAAVQFEAKNIFPFDTDAAHVRQLYAGEVRQGNDTRQEVIVLAARHDETSAFVEQLHRCGCLIESLDFEPAAVYRSVERFIRRREDEQEVFVLVDVGLRCAQVIIGRGREMSFFKTIDIGGRAFNEAVSRKVEITVDEARELRRRMIDETRDAALTAAEQRSACTNDPVRQAVFDATRSLMDELAREVSLCLRYHSVTFRGHRPGKLRLIGGEACDPQLQAILSAALPIPVEAMRPMYSVDTSRMQAGDRRGRMSEWTVALGLGLKLTRDYFGARDGKQRTEPAPAAPAPGTAAEVVDVARAAQIDSPSALTAGAIAAASGTRTPGAERPEALHA
jgi:type IV pilus assembly protein PilM